MCEQLFVSKCHSLNYISKLKGMLPFEPPKTKSDRVIIANWLIKSSPVKHFMRWCCLCPVPKAFSAMPTSGTLCISMMNSLWDLHMSMIIKSKPWMLILWEIHNTWLKVPQYNPFLGKPTMKSLILTRKHFWLEWYGYFKGEWRNSAQCTSLPENPHLYGCTWLWNNLYIGKGRFSHRMSWRRLKT